MYTNPYSRALNIIGNMDHGLRVATTPEPINCRPCLLDSFWHKQERRWKFPLGEHEKLAGALSRQGVKVRSVALCTVISHYVRAPGQRVFDPSLGRE